MRDWSSVLGHFPGRCLDLASSTLMGFVTPALLGGALLVAVPIVLHLIMRRESTKLQFPALRFVQRRQSLNQHRLRLRHWLLLALRCAIIALLAFALARPTLRGSGVAGQEGKQIAAALVFDNSLRMQYEYENDTRLAKAKKLAGWLLEQFPAEGPVTVIDRSGRYHGSDLDRSAAELRVERLELSAAVRPLEDALRDAASWIESQPEFRGEIYVFTDLAAEAWPEDSLKSLAARLEELPGTNVYLIDVGVEQPRDLGLTGLRLSGQQLAPGGILQLDTDLQRIGAPAAEDDEVVVELYVGNDSANAEKRGRQSFTPEENASLPVEFSLTGLDLGTHQGYVRIVGNDALPCDNVRYFTVDVRPPSKVLLLAETDDDAVFLREALAPTATGLAPARFACEVRPFTQLTRLPLADFQAVFLVDPPPLAAAGWQALVEYVERGGGLGVFLGRNAVSKEFNQSGPQQLLPAKLRWQSRNETHLRPVAVEHPALAELRDLGDAVPWLEFPVFRYWELESGDAAAHVVSSFANGKPALVERQIGDGRVLMLTTSVSDPAYDDPWNLLPTAPDPWPFLALVNGIAHYLAGASDAQLNYLAGQTVVLRLLPEEQTTNFVLQMPGGVAVRQTLAPGENELTIASTDALGNYRVRAGGRQERLDRGFSVNCSAEMSQLRRIPAPRIIAALGKDRVRVARTRGEIEVRVGIGRVGRELFPALILAVALVLGAEQLLSNRFYRAPQ
jgi:hypothetical protein